MFSIYTTAGVLAHLGPDGKPYTDAKAADASAQDRNSRAEGMGLKVRYEVRKAPEKAAA
jgi:hypothetical protein